MSGVYVLVVTALVSALLGFFRLLAGPTTADRVVALDLLFAVAIVMCIGAALVSRNAAFLDVAVGLSLVGFVGTIAWARLVERRGDEHGEAP